MRSIGGRQLARSIGHWSEGQGTRPAYIRLADAIRTLILDGRLPLETRLPGERELAGALEVSRTTVTAAYDLLRTTGYAASRQGSGTRSALPANRSGTSAGSPWTPFGPDGSDILDLAHAAPEAPGHALTTAYQAALEQLPRQLPTCGYNLFGLPELRAVIAARFTARGLATEPEQILVTSGAQHAFSLVLSLITDPGDRVLIDHPTYPNAIDAIRRAMARPVPVPLLEDGWDLDAFEAAVRQTAPRLAYIVPDFHNPTGLLASDDERRAMASALGRNRTLTVVDETLAELPLEGQVPSPAATYLPRGLAITIGSASKTLWGGLRVGWIRAEESLIRRLAAVRASIDISSPVIDQLVVAELIRVLDDVLSERLPELRERREVLLATLAEAVPDWRVRRPAGGLVLWCDMGRPLSSSMVMAAERYGIRLAGGPRFGVEGAFERRLRLPYTLPSDVLRQAGTAIGQAFSAIGAAPPPATGQLQAVFA
ncbi:PLP-dependent aminotransferase family protein [Phytoactinopolyspora mesophila]|uniref:Aminotransferase class I/II-fold pyridoxal phosphate-dependent enzyme n=1 Tax=Phytoactinopolyspora mesophila TaxID=2650750 RepID=A0A7K3MA04_9ACTN|nr:PLP-dependent aminotransferase family protein [Phytoactinopolyspora mesophila]NDL59837.1 aminotransferase class I/II-fold pyridoxal phosphate-dependent enzyme [Phytoactinopolyspora mesophila]